MLGSKNAKICVTPNANANICVTPNANPQATRWNIGGIGSPMRGAGVGHVDFMLFVSISFVLVSQCKLTFQWNMGLTIFVFYKMSLVERCQTP